MPSIDGAFIGLARYIRDHFPDLSWFPLWYGGIPFPDCYPPLLHAAVALVSGAGHISAGLAYHAVVATFYSLGPAALYWAARHMDVKQAPSFFASLGYSLLAPSIWLVPELRESVGSWFGACRLDALVRWGEGPHVTSLLLLPVALGALHVALQRRKAKWYFAAAAAMAAVALSNWIGSLSLALLVGAYLLAGFSAQWLPLWARVAGTSCWAYALAAPFVTPSTIATIQANAPIVAGGYVPNHPLEFGFAAGALLLAIALRWAQVDPKLRFALLFTYLTGAITLLAYWFKLRVVPQPERYHLEMDMAFWLVVALLADQIRPHSLTKSIRLTGRAILAAILVFSVWVAIRQHRRAQEIEQRIDIKTTAEYQLSYWLGEHLPGQRVFAPGTIGFWMQAFSDTPMLTGGFDNGMRNTILQEINYQIYAGDRQDIMVSWLKAYGVAAVIGGGPKSKEFYHPYAHPDKFLTGRLPAEASASALAAAGGTSGPGAAGSASGRVAAGSTSGPGAAGSASGRVAADSTSGLTAAGSASGRVAAGSTSGPGAAGSASGRVAADSTSGLGAAGSTSGRVAASGTSSLGAAGSASGRVAAASTSGLGAAGSASGRVAAGSTSGLTAAGSASGRVAASGTSSLGAAGSASGRVAAGSTSGLTAAGSASGRVAAGSTSGLTAAGSASGRVAAGSTSGLTAAPKPVPLAAAGGAGGDTGFAEAQSANSLNRTAPASGLAGGSLPEIYRDDTEVIYAVPRRRSSLAHAMPASDLIAERPPTYYAKPLDHYLAALDDPAYPDADFRWRSASSAVINGNLQADQILSVQITWDQGWHALVNGHPVRTWQDKLGQMAVAPLCSGPCTVELAYDGGLEQLGARWLCTMGWLAGLICIAMSAFRKRVNS